MTETTNLHNLRPLVVDVPGITTRDSALRWLEQQNKAIQAVTSVAKDGTLVQTPAVSKDAYVDPTAQLIGGVIVERGCYIGPCAVIRLDEIDPMAPLVIEEDSNVQDGALVHSTTRRIGSRVIVAHQAIVHGADVDSDVTIYIQAVVDGGGTVIGKGSFLHQGSYVGKNIQVPDNRYVAPGVKVLTQAEADTLPPIPAPLNQLRATVLEHNRSHVTRHKRSAAH
ncbi:MAG: hypothetical protein QNJ97_07995 [Myxococcota bacterium]|nr:hypothetical protein [Myxococcota bacterium]